MGSQVSRQSRNLPKALNQSAVNNANVKKKPLTQNKLSFAHKQTEQETTHDANEVLKKHEQDRIQEDEKAKENAKRMGFIKLEEIPLKLDQNHPSLRILKNRRRLESESKHDKEQQTAGTSLEKTSVTPNEFVSIVDDQQHFSEEQIIKNYNLSKSFLEPLRNAGLETATKKRVQSQEKKDRVDEINEKKVTKTGWTRSEAEQNRMNGVYHKSNTRLENALEDLLKH